MSTENNNPPLENTLQLPMDFGTELGSVKASNQQGETDEDFYSHVDLTK